MQKMFISVLLLSASAVVFLVPAVTPVSAETTIINSVSVSSNTGGNTATNGTVVEGKSESSVDIVTVIDGEIVEEVHERSIDGEPVVIERTTQTVEGDAAVKTYVNLTSGDTPEATTHIDPKSEGEKHLPSITSSSTPNQEGVGASTSITNLNKSSDESLVAEEEQNSPSLFTRIIDSVSRAIAYALSTFFS